MDPYTRAMLLAAPAVAKTIGGFFKKPPQQGVSSDTTGYLNKLRNVSKEGLYGQDVKNEVSTDVAQRSNDTKLALRSNAIKSGMENSGVLAQQLIKEGGNTTLQAAKIAKKIHQMNEESKLNASKMASEVGQGIEGVKYQNALARFGHSESNRNNFWDAVSLGTGGYIEGKDKEAYASIANDPDFLSWLLNR